MSSSSESDAIHQSDKHFEFFLSSLKVEESIIKKMKDDKITIEVVCNMSDRQLMEYVSSYGTRIMIFGYCQRSISSTASGKKKRKRGILNMLKNKLNKQNEIFETAETTEEQKSTPDRKKGRPTNVTRKIEIGWLHEDTPKSMKQVKLKTGGGTRKTDILKTSTYKDILNIGKLLFFPGGISSKGHDSDFDFDLKDFAQNELDMNESVGDMYDKTKINLLRFYLVTKAKHTKLPRVTSTVTSSSITLNNSTAQNTDNSDISILTPITKEKTNDLLNEAISDVGIDLSEFSTSDDSGIISFNPRYQNDYGETFSSMLDELTSTGSSQHTTESLGNELVIRLRISNLMEDLIDAFSDKNILRNSISYQRILTNGDAETGAGSGVERDTYSAFWASFYDKYTVGDEAKVPVIRHDMSAEKWQAVARIIIKGYETSGYWPLKIASPFFEEVMFGCVLSSLEDVFYNHVNLAEKETIKSAIQDFKSIDEDELIDILATYDCHKMATAENLQSLIKEIAHKELIQKPMFVIDSMRNVFAHERTVLDVDEYMTMYRKLKPSTKSVLAKVNFPESMNERQNIVANHLKRFIRGLENKELGLFLRFCTGSDQLTEGDIVITFSEMSDFSKRPIARTCGKSLELPMEFENFTEFKLNFSGVLHSNIWVMDIV